MTQRPESAPGDAAELPTICVVTASLNRAAFLEEAMRSVLALTKVAIEK